MSQIRIFDQTRPDRVLFESRDHAEIASRLGALGVRFERWEAAQPIAPGASQEAVIAAYQRDIDRLMQEEGYVAVDVVSLTPEHPDRAALRNKFLSEHTHGEDEVRFFVAGSGLFNLHPNDSVYEVLCEAGDLISVPANTRHWFDMSAEPNFVAIRLFNNPQGWVATFTGDPVAEQFPRYERKAA